MKKTRKLLRALRRKLRRATKYRQRRYLKRLIGRMRDRILRIEESHREGVDWGYGHVPARFLIEEGKDFAVRYLSTDDDKRLTRFHAEELSDGGVDLVAVWQDSHDAALQGRERGERDARLALMYARKLGIPEDRPIYFAVDFEVQSHTYPAVAQYFWGVRAVLGKRTGAYGGLYCMQRLCEDNIIYWGWQTYAWSNHVWCADPRVRLRQVLITLPDNELLIHGTYVDYCKSVHRDFGQWRV